MENSFPSLDISALRKLYRDGTLTPVDIVEHLLARIEAAAADNIWISRVSPEQLRAETECLARIPSGERHKYPLYGIPFAVKDCIDVAGQPTTAACPEYAYTPEVSASSVQRLLDAGGIYVGKTNLDQFATGLVGVRSPYGTPKNPFNTEFIPGGSSSGSAVAVSIGLVSFALGTDTGGSGRVPASYTNTVGLKPTVHRISSRGMVHACRSFDCVTVYALTPKDAMVVVDVAQGLDPLNPWSRALPDTVASRRYVEDDGFNFGVPGQDQLEFFGDAASETLFAEAVATLERFGGRRVDIDYSPFLEVNEMMFQGPFVAEREASVGTFLRRNPGVGDQSVRQIILGADRFNAADAFSMLYRLQELRQTIAPLWERIDVLVLPAVGRPYRMAELEIDPIGPNFNNGYYTNFSNPLDLAALAIPNGFHPDCVPIGITLNGPAFSEDYLVGLGERFQSVRVSSLGATDVTVPAAAA